MKQKIQNKKQKSNINFDITKFTFLRDLVLVEELREGSTNGLLNPSAYEDKPQFGRIIKLGNDIKNIKINDIVRFGKYSSELIRTNGHDYYIIHEEDISAVL